MRTRASSRSSYNACERPKNGATSSARWTCAFPAPGDERTIPRPHGNLRNSAVSGVTPHGVPRRKATIDNGRVFVYESATLELGLNFTNFIREASRPVRVAVSKGVQHFKSGDLVEVKSEAEILATLDAEG